MIPTHQIMDSAPLNAEAIELSGEEIKWLAEIGFIAPELGLTKMAITIFQALMKCRPEADFPWIGMAHAYLGAGRYREATQLLEETIKRHPNSLEVKTLLAMALKLENRNSEADRLLKNILQEPADHRTKVIHTFAEALQHPNAVSPPKTFGSS